MKMGPLWGWRLLAAVMLGVGALAEFGVLGFHEPDPKFGPVLLLFGIGAIILCICDVAEQRK